jgi:hypothetical protein
MEPVTVPYQIVSRVPLLLDLVPYSTSSPFKAQRYVQKQRALYVQKRYFVHAEHANNKKISLPPLKQH